jgi:hypothetical protein
MLNRVESIKQAIETKSLDVETIIGILNLHKDKKNISEEEYNGLLELVEPSQVEEIIVQE